MDVGEWALIASIVFSGLWSGLLAMLTLILHPVMVRMDGPDFAHFLRAFLPISRKSPLNYACLIGIMVAPVIALFDLDDTPFALTATGLALTFVGAFVVSSRLSEPNYDVMLGWNPDALPRNWEATRRYYFRLNWIRAAASWAAFGLFLAALVVAL